MESVGQFIYGNEVYLPLDSVKIGDLFFTDFEDKIAVYKKTKKGKKLIKIVENYGELYKIENINIEPPVSNFILLNP